MAYDLGHHIIMVAYDGDDPNGSPTGELTDVFDKSFRIAHNAPGAGEFKVNRHSSQRTITQPDAYVRCYLDDPDSDPVFAFWITESSDVVLAPGEDGAEVMQKSGEGAMAYMADAVVWYEAVTTNDSAAPGDNDDMWHWVGVHPAGILVRMIEEAVERGCYPDLTYDFSRTTDSNGDAWTTTVDDFQLQVGTDLLTLMGYLQTMGLVFVMDHDLVLHAYEAATYGSDLSGTVVFTKGIDISETADRHQVSSPARSTVLVKGARADNGETAWVEADSVAGLAETGRRKEGFFDAQETTHFDTLQTIGLEEIYQKLRLKVGPTNLVVLPLDTQAPLADYNVGDTVTVDVPGIWNSDAKPITYIGFTQRSNDEYDVAVGFEDAPALRSLATTGPDGQPVGPPPIQTQPCCPPEGPFVPPTVDDDCGLAAAVTLHIGSHSFFGDPSPPDHNFDYASIQGITATLTTGMQYRQLVTVAFNNPTTGSDSTMSGDPFIYLAYPTGGTPANPPGPSGAIIDAATWGWSVGGVSDNGIDTASNGGFPGGYGTGATFDSGWKTFDGPDVVADIIARGIPSSGFHGFEAIYDVRIEVRNGDGTAIVCDDDVQTVPHEGQHTTEQASGTGTTRFTNFPYVPGSLQVWVGGVLVQVTETDPATGEFELPFDPGSSPVVVHYQATGGAGTGAGNTQPPPGTYPIPHDVIVGFETYDGGGNPLVLDHGNMGATETVDAADGNHQRGTLDANCTITVTAFDEGGIILWLYQDGTGGRTVTWSGVTFAGDDQPDTTAGSPTPFVLMSDDGAVYGFKGGGGTTLSFATPAIVLGTAAAAGAASTVIRSDSTIVAFDATVPVTQAVGDTAATGSAAFAARRDHKHAVTRPALDDLSDVVITSAATGDRIRYNGSNFVNSPAIWVPVMVEDGATGLWYVAVTGDGDAVMTEVS